MSITSISAYNNSFEKINALKNSQKTNTSMAISSHALNKTNGVDTVSFKGDDIGDPVLYDGNRLSKIYGNKVKELPKEIERRISHAVNTAAKGFSDMFFTIFD